MRYRCGYFECENILNAGILIQLFVGSLHVVRANASRYSFRLKKFESGSTTKLS